MSAGTLLVVFSSRRLSVSCLQIVLCIWRCHPSTQEWFTWCCWISWHRCYFLQCMYHFLLGLHFVKLRLHS